MIHSKEELEKIKAFYFKKSENYETLSDFFQDLSSKNGFNYVSWEERRENKFTRGGKEARIVGLRGIISEGVCNSISFYTIGDNNSNNSQFKGIGFVLHHNPEMISQSTIDLIDHVSKYLDVYFNLLGNSRIRTK